MTEAKDAAPKPAKQPRSTFCVYLYGDELVRARAYAKNQGRSLTKIVREALLAKMGDA